MSTSSPTSATFSTLFSNSVLSRLERLRLNPRRRMTERTHGEHLSGKGGTSTEFSDYRDYVPGDDIRNVDWNIFARLQKPFIKLYRHEEELNIVLIIDASKSMDYDGKLLRAKQIALACGVMGLYGNEKVSAHAPGNASGISNLPACTGRPSLRRLIHFIESVQTGGAEPIEEAIETVLRTHRGRGMVFVLSDFLTFGDYERAFNRLHSAGLEISAIRILSEAEIHPELSADLRLVDCETGQEVDVSSVNELIGYYHEHLEFSEATLNQACQQRSGRYLRCTPQEPLESLLFDTLRRKGWLR